MKSDTERVIYISIILGLLCIFGLMLRWKDDQKDIAIQNYEAMKDSVDVYKLKNGDLLYEKSMLIQSESELRETLDITKKEYSELEKKLGSAISTITKLESSIGVDSIVMVIDSIVYVYDTTTYWFGYNDPYLKLLGTVRVEQYDPKILLYNIDIPVNLEVGITEDYKYFVKSSNPYLSVHDITGVVSKESHKKVAVMHGFSLGFGLQYGMINKSLDLGPNFGYSIVLSF